LSGHDLPAPGVAWRCHAGIVINSRRLGLGHIVEQGSPEQDGTLPVVPAAPRWVCHQCLRDKAGAALHISFARTLRVRRSAIPRPEPSRGVLDRAPVDARGFALRHKMAEHYHRDHVCRNRLGRIGRDCQWFSHAMTMATKSGRTYLKRSMTRPSSSILM